MKSLFLHLGGFLCKLYFQLRLQPRDASRNDRSHVRSASSTGSRTENLNFANPSSAIIPSGDVIKHLVQSEPLNLVAEISRYTDQYSSGRCHSVSVSHLPRGACSRLDPDHRTNCMGLLRRKDKCLDVWINVSSGFGEENGGPCSLP